MCRELQVEMTLLIVFVMAFHSYPCKTVFTKYAKSGVFWDVRECMDSHGVALATIAGTVVFDSLTLLIDMTKMTSAEEARFSRKVFR